MGQQGACEDCVLKCLVMHGRKHHSSSLVCSFFKVIIDDQFSELFVPPEFAPTLISLVNKEILIEDVRGRKWKVKLSHVKGRLAFEKGWRAFALDHNIKIGDFIVFHYIGEHFVVKIFGRNGCEKMNPPNILSNKRVKTTANLRKDKDNRKGLTGSAVVIPNSDTLQDKMEVECIGVRDKIETVPSQENNYKQRQVVTVHSQEPLMMNWDVRFGEEEDDGNRLLDLSELEFINTRAPDKRGSSNGVLKGIKSSKASDAFATLPARSTSGPLVLHSENAIEDRVERIDTLTVSERWHSNQLLKHTTTESNGFSPSSGGSGRIVKIEPREGINLKSLAEMESNSLATRNFNIQNSQICLVKPEPADFFDVPVPSPLVVACAVTQDSEYYLEMPASLPSVQKNNTRSRKKVVFLRDPSGRLWPAFYLEKHNVKVLAWGWRSFRETNQIQSGDVCVFAIENEAEGFYTVQIMHK